MGKLVKYHSLQADPNAFEQYVTVVVIRLQKLWKKYNHSCDKFNCFVVQSQIEKQIYF